jgi:hypothetical protein
MQAVIEGRQVFSGAKDSIYSRGWQHREVGANNTIRVKLENWQKELKTKKQGKATNSGVTTAPATSAMWGWVAYRQTGKQTSRQTDRKTDRQTYRRTDRQTDRHTIGQSDWQVEKHTYGDIQIHTDRQIDRYTNKQTDRQMLSDLVCPSCLGASWSSGVTSSTGWETCSLSATQSGDIDHLGSYRSQKSASGLYTRGIGYQPCLHSACWGLRS